MPSEERSPAPKRIPGLRGWELWRALGPLKSRPHDFLLELAIRFGGITDLPFPLERVVLISRPEYIEYILHHNYANYLKSTGRWSAFRELIGNSVLTLDGQAWRRQRQRVQPAYHANRLTVLEAFVHEEFGAMCERWRDRIDRDAPVDTLHEMAEVSLRVMTRTMFSRDVEAVIEPMLTAFRMAHRFINPFSVANLLDPPPVVRRMLSPGVARFERAYRVLNDLVEKIIRERMDTREDTGDILSMLIQGRDEEVGETMTPRQVRDDIMTTLMAGHEPAAVALTWTLYLLAKHPAIQQNVSDEIDEVLGDRPVGLQDLPRLKYTKMVIDESMRLYPPVWGIDRRAVNDDDVDGYRIPAGSTVALSTYVVHRHPAYWQEPEKFDPLRFSEEQSHGRPQYMYFPFGGGPRRCVGFRFGTIHVHMLVTSILQRHRLDLVPGQTITPQPLINLFPRQRVWLMPRLRVPATARVSV